MVFGLAGGYGSKAEGVPVRNKATVARENVATCWKKPMVQACVRVGARALGRRACALIRQPWRAVVLFLGARAPVCVWLCCACACSCRKASAVACWCTTMRASVPGAVHVEV